MTDHQAPPEGERALNSVQAHAAIAKLPSLAARGTLYDAISREAVLRILARVAAPAPPAAGGLAEEMLELAGIMETTATHLETMGLPAKVSAKAWASTVRGWAERAAVVEAARPAPLPLPSDFIEREPEPTPRGPAGDET
jgi:hypothetical protein